jgi:hypothetical protein
VSNNANKDEQQGEQLLPLTTVAERNNRFKPRNWWHNVAASTRKCVEGPGEQRERRVDAFKNSVESRLSQAQAE